MKKFKLTLIDEDSVVQDSWDIEVYSQKEFDSMSDEEIYELSSFNYVEEDLRPADQYNSSLEATIERRLSYLIGN